MRAGNFSSSNISKLMSKGRGNFSLENIGSPFTTYVEEKYFERMLGRSLNTENNARSTAWGTLVEEQAFTKMGLQYSLVSKERYYHEIYKDYWNGMPDILTDDIVGDIKSPWTLKSFCQLVKAIENVETFKEEYSEYYWQLVSNSILTGRNTALIVVYLPFKEDLQEIKELANNGENKFAFISWAEEEELPYLEKEGKYNDLNSLEFEVPEEDKKLLTARVEMAINELNKMLQNGIQ